MIGPLRSVPWPMDFTKINDAAPTVFTDIDGMNELNGHFLFIEWKGTGKDLDGGQARAFERLTMNPNCTVFVVNGDVRYMIVNRMYEMRNAKIRNINNAADLDYLRSRIRAWARHADPARTKLYEAAE